MMPLLVQAQHPNFNTRPTWTLNKKELILGGGITQFNGDLGGVNKLGPEHGIGDSKWPSTGWNGLVGYRHRFQPYWATTSSLQIGQLRGNDALKIDPYKHSRNLHFRSSYVELSQRLEVLLLVNEKLGSRYTLRKKPRRYYQIYAFAGAGLLYYNPQARYDGKWTNLRPLNTEGQGLPDGPIQYQRITVSIPIGFGGCVGISNWWRLGIEVAYISTFSDYLDDVGGVYYDQNQLTLTYGEASAHLSNPSIQNTAWFTKGQPRGDNKLDSFFTFTILLKRNIFDKSFIKKTNTTNESL